MHLPDLLRMSSRYWVMLSTWVRGSASVMQLIRGNAGSDLAVTLAEPELAILLELDEVTGGIQVSFLQRSGDFFFGWHGPFGFLSAGGLGCGRLTGRDPEKWLLQYAAEAESGGGHRMRTRKARGRRPRPR